MDILSRSLSLSPQTIQVFDEDADTVFLIHGANGNALRMNGAVWAMPGLDKLGLEQWLWQRGAIRQLKEGYSVRFPPASDLQPPRWKVHENG